MLMRAAEAMDMERGTMTMVQYLVHLKQNDPKTMRQARERVDIRGGNRPHQRRKLPLHTKPDKRVMEGHKGRKRTIPEEDIITPEEKITMKNSKTRQKG
eukprot:6390677-Ditylum_brightwellii.AAC.1